MGKNCSKCGVFKKLNEFQKDKRGKQGVESKCKSCRSSYLKKYKVETQYDKIYYDNNKEIRKEKQKEWVNNNKEKYNKYQNNYQKQNKYQSQKIYFEKNKSELMEKGYIRRNERIKNNLLYKLRLRISTDICNRLKRSFISKNTTTVNYLGCDIKYYKEYLTNKLYPEMNWENYGNIWEIDHIIPISKFDMSVEENIYAAFNYNNTQPLFKTTDIARSFGYNNEVGNRNKSNKN